MPYTNSSLDKVREADILTVISKYVDLKKSGSNYQGLSPFKSEKTPSFMVSPAKQIWKCFGSGKGGNDAIGFVMANEGKGFIEAVKIVAEICNITLDQEPMSEEAQAKYDEAQKIKSLNTNVAEEYARQLSKLPADHWAKKHLKDLGYTQDEIIMYQIGYTPGGLVSKASVKSAKLDLAITAGLVKTKSGTSYDFFFDRIMFPIHNAKNEVLGFGGRCSRDNQDKTAKYLNSPQSTVFNKSRSLYGIRQARREILKRNEAILVEGYTDVISMYKAGATNTVATCGTALTQEHCEKLKPLAGHVILFRDGDQAGLDAMERDLDLLLAAGRRVSVVIPEAGEDPDTITRNVGDIQKYIDERLQDGVEWKAQHCLDQVPGYLEKRLIKEKMSESKATANALKVIDGKIKSLDDNDPTDLKALKAARDKQQKLKDQYQEQLGEIQQLQEAVDKGLNPVDLVAAFKKVVETLANIESELIRKEYYKPLSKTYKYSITDINKEVKAFLAKKESEKMAKAKRNGLDNTDFLKLPKGADMEEYKEKGYCTIKNVFYVKSKDGFTRASNFKLTPLFHVEGDKDTSRLFDVVNENNEKSLIELESSVILNPTQNQNRLLDYGVYLWDPELSSNNFKLIMSDLIRRFIKVRPFSFFGWQSKGFWAYSNGVFNDGEFLEVNEYGIVSVEGLEHIDSQYYNNTPYYYSPAFNVTNKYKEDDLDQYQNDRSFVYKKAPITFNTWMKQFTKVYDDKAHIGIGFAIATMFKDFIMGRYSFFPLLFCSGEKGSGKSAFSNSLANLFTYKQQAFQIDSGSKVGFFRRLQRGRNTATVMEEYHDKIDPEKFQALKGAWDGRGREIGVMSNDSRTKVSEVRCSLMVVGQYLSSRDDNSLTSRSIICRFIKPQQQFSDDKIRDFNTLLEWEDAGLTSLVLEIIKYRAKVEADFHEAYLKNSRKFKKALEKFEYQERMMQNYNAIYTPVAILYNLFKFPFSLEEWFAQCVHGIIDNSDLLIESEGLSEFWNVIGKLAEKNIIREDEHYCLDTPVDQKITTRKGEADETYINSDRSRLLYIRINSVHQDYADAVSKRDGVDVIGEATLRTYFKSKRYFIGPTRTKRIGGNAVSSYVFNYDMMADNGILMLPGKASKKMEDSAPHEEGIFSTKETTPGDGQKDLNEIFGGK